MPSKSYTSYGKRIVKGWEMIRNSLSTLTILLFILFVVLLSTG